MIDRDVKMDNLKEQMDEIISELKEIEYEYIDAMSEAQSYRDDLLCLADTDYTASELRECFAYWHNVAERIESIAYWVGNLCDDMECSVDDFADELEEEESDNA